MLAPIASAHCAGSAAEAGFGPLRTKHLATMAAGNIRQTPLARQSASPTATDLLNPMRQEGFLTDRAGLGVPFPRVRTVTGMGAEPAIAPERLAAVIARLAGLIGIGSRSPAAGFAAKNHACSGLGRDRTIAPQALAPLTCRDPLGPFFSPLELASTFLIAEFATDGAVCQRLAAPAAS